MSWFKLGACPVRRGAPITFLATLLVLPLPTASASAGESDGFARGRLIVNFRDGVISPPTEHGAYVRSR